MNPDLSPHAVTPASGAQPAPTPRRKLWVPLAAGVAVGLISLGFAAAQNLRAQTIASPHKSQSQTSSSKQGSLLADPPGAPSAKGYRLYQQRANPKSYPLKLTLVDAKGNTAQTAEVPYKLGLVAVLADGFFVLREDAEEVQRRGGEIGGGDFWIASKSGIAKAGAAANDYLRDWHNEGPMFAAGSHQVVYNFCLQKGTPMGNCSLHMLDVLTGKHEKLASKALAKSFEPGSIYSRFSIRNYWDMAQYSKLDMQISSDGRALYFLDVSVDPGAWSLDRKENAAPGTHFADLIAYDFRTDKILSTRRVSALSNSHSTFWISPTGETIVSSDNGSSVTLVNVADDEHTLISLGDLSVSPGGGGSASNFSGGPLLWSPDGKKFIFTSYLSNKVEDHTLTLLDVAKKATLAIAHHVGEYRQGQLPSIEYANISWLTNGRIAFNEVTAPASDLGYERYANNYEYDLGAGSPRSSPPTIGEFVGGEQYTP